MSENEEFIPSVEEIRGVIEWRHKMANDRLTPEAFDRLIETLVPDAARLHRALTRAGDELMQSRRLVARLQDALDERDRRISELASAQGRLKRKISKLKQTLEEREGVGTEVIWKIAERLYNEHHAVVRSSVKLRWGDLTEGGRTRDYWYQVAVSESRAAMEALEYGNGHN